MTLEQWFQKTYSADLPVKPAEPLVDLDARDWGSEMWGTANLQGKVPPPPMVPEFREDLGDYTLAGRWGRGSNSYALYLVERRGAHRHFFRLLIQGAYVDEAMLAQLAVGFLRGYQEFRAETLPKLTRSRIVHNMGNAEVELEAAGKKVAFKSATEGEAFWAELAAALKKG